MLAEAEFVENGNRIRGKDLLRRAVRIKRKQDRDKSAHDMGVTVAEVVQPELTAAICDPAFLQPNLARAALDLVGCGMLGVGHRIERAAELDDIAVAVIPIFKQREIVLDFVDVCHVEPGSPNVYIRTRIDESDTADGAGSMDVPRPPRFDVLNGFR